jgi:transcriptional regulator with XRE-family HTH domain
MQEQKTLARKFFLWQCHCMKTLAQYLDEKGRGAAADLARKIGKSESTVWRLARGNEPLVKTALAIEDATGGAVPVRAWVE